MTQNVVGEAQPHRLRLGAGDDHAGRSRSVFITIYLRIVMREEDR